MSNTRFSNNDPAIGQNIKSQRQALGYSVQDLAEYTGMSRALITQIENEQVSPPISTLIKIANALQTDVSFFFQDRTEPPPRLKPGGSGGCIAYLSPALPMYRYVIQGLDMR